MFETKGQATCAHDMAAHLLHTACTHTSDYESADDSVQLNDRAAAINTSMIKTLSWCMQSKCVISMSY